jgi:hypothetical protein
MRPALLAPVLVVLTLHSSPVLAQVKGTVPSATPAWSKGIQAISRDSYWSAVSCGKQPGARPACLFYEAELCANDEFTLAFYTPYKQVAYTVWQAVSRKQPAPTPSYPEAQRMTRMIIAVRPKHASQNPVTGLTITRGKTVVDPSSRSLDSGAGTFYFEFSTFAPTAPITLTMAGKTKTVTCAIDRASLGRMR